MSRRIKFGDQVIDGIASWRSSYSSRAVAEVFPRRDGGIIQSATFMSPRTVAVTGIASKDTEALLDTHMDDLAERLVNLGLNKLYKDAADSRYLNAIMQKYEEGESATGMAPTRERTFRIDFLAHDPYWYAASESSDSNWVPAASPETKTLTNSGGTGTPPRFEIENTSGADLTGTLILKHMTLGSEISWTGTISNGSTLIIDCGEYTIMQGGTNKMFGFDSGSEFFDLIMGTNDIRYTGDLNVSIDSYWRHRWGS